MVSNFCAMIYVKCVYIGGLILLNYFGSICHGYW